MPRKKTPKGQKLVFANPTHSLRGLEAFQDHAGHSHRPYQEVPVPPPSKALSLSTVAPEAAAAATRSGRIAFHTIGDTGGVKRPEAQQIVADKLEGDFRRIDGAPAPAFFYHLGDVVYYFGDAADYDDQFYQPYIHYPAPIFAIPGNHDGDVDASNPHPTLRAFVDNFCAQRPGRSRDAIDSDRSTMMQPGVHWTLVAPFVTIIGLYTNVPEGGEVRSPQVEWFLNELRTAPKDRALIVALHHPVYSLDKFHSGSVAMKTLLDRGFRSTGRHADLVLSGHVHNYQRFTEVQAGRQIPYIVAGAGGYWHLHAMVPQLKNVQRPVSVSRTLTLESFVADRHGFLRLEVEPGTIRGEYYTTPRPHESWSAPPELWDSFALDLKRHELRL